MMHPLDDRLKKLMQARQPIRGLFNGLGSPALVEMSAWAGFDFVVIDNEHGGASIETTEHMLRAARASGIPSLVRCLRHDIARTLDAGAPGIKVPMVQSVAEAAEIVQRVRYPRATGSGELSGQRGSAYSVRAAGYGLMGGAAHNARSNRDVVLIVMLETVAAIDQAAEIAALPGIDGVFIGPNDLAHSMGYEDNFSHPAVQAQIERGLRAIAKAGSCAGTLALTAEEEARYAGWGATYFATVITRLITRALKEAAQSPKPVTSLSR